MVCCVAHSKAGSIMSCAANRSHKHRAKAFGKEKKSNKKLLSAYRQDYTLKVASRGRRMSEKWHALLERTRRYTVTLMQKCHSGVWEAEGACHIRDTLVSEKNACVVCRKSAQKVMDTVALWLDALKLAARLELSPNSGSCSAKTGGFMCRLLMVHIFPQGPLKKFSTRLHTQSLSHTNASNLLFSFWSLQLAPSSHNGIRVGIQFAN